MSTSTDSVARFTDLVVKEAEKKKEDGTGTTLMDCLNAFDDWVAKASPPADVVNSVYRNLLRMERDKAKTSIISIDEEIKEL